MFIYLVALIATLFFIFGLLHLRCSNGWLQSSISYFSNLYNGLTHRSMIEASLQDENLENNLIAARSERPFIVINEWREHDNISDILDNTERLSVPILEEPEIKLRNLNPLYNLENIASTEMNKDVTRTLQLGIVDTTKDSVIGTSRHEGSENIFESSKNSNENITTNQLNTELIRNLIMKETIKENEAKQKLVDSFNNKLTDSPIEKRDHPSASKIEYKDNLTKSKSNDII